MHKQEPPKPNDAFIYNGDILGSFPIAFDTFPTSSLFTSHICAIEFVEHIFCAKKQFDANLDISASKFVCYKNKSFEINFSYNETYDNIYFSLTNFEYPINILDGFKILSTEFPAIENSGLLIIIYLSSF